MAKTYRRGLLTRLVNGAFQQMARRGLGAHYLHELTVRGRKSGQLHSTPVDVMDLGGQRWLVAPYGVTGWVRNVRVSGEAAITRGGRTEKVGVVPAGREEAVPVLRKYMKDVPVTRAYFDATADAPDEAIAAELDRHPVFRLVPVA
ncbi:MAG: nitroreductase/quinone reductase family protein [Chloroflexota bacterium]